MGTVKRSVAIAVCGAAWVGVLALAPPAVGGPLSGTVTTRTAAGVPPAAVIAYAEPLDTAAPRRPGRFTLAQKNRGFQPAVLAVPVGSVVEFPNRDLIFHNVFSLSPPQPFDLGLYRAGESKSRTFTQPGTYRVFCNIHPEMTAVIVVVPTAYVVQADGRGRFVLDLPAGRYRLTVLSERAAAPVTVDVSVGAGATTAPDLVLDESAFVRVVHKNKFGQDYATTPYETRPRK
jgi:plastocyanin